MTVPSPAFGDPIGPWRPWFAWRPIRTFDWAWCWWKPVVRRRVQKHDYLPYGAPEQWWQYALPGDVPTPSPSAQEAG